MIGFPFVFLLFFLLGVEKYHWCGVTKYQRNPVIDLHELPYRFHQYQPKVWLVQVVEQVPKRALPSYVLQADFHFTTPRGLGNPVNRNDLPVRIISAVNEGKI